MAEADDIPRLDEIEGWPLPEEQAEWFGSPADERTLIEAYRGGRMHHAWLIGGPRGSGKATLAYRFARFALTHPDPESAPDADTLAVPAGSPVARKIAARAHPNLLPLARPWSPQNKRFLTALPIDEIRRTTPFFGSTAGEAGWRIAIVDTANEMNTNAANALLKILEEPPKHSLLLLLSHSPGRLLPTIRSRCRRLDLAPLSEEAIEAALSRHGGAAPEAARLAAAAAEGSLRRAIRLLDEDMQAIHRAFAGFVARLPAFDGSAHALGDLVAQRGADEAFEVFGEMLFGWLARRVRGLPERGHGPALPAAVVATPLARWAEVWEKLRQSSSEVEILNLDRKQYVLTALTMLAHATRM